jgi:hypothetical protein
LECFRRAGAIDDAAYLIESVMTPEELLRYAAKYLPKPDPGASAAPEENELSTDIQDIPEAVGRRLVREGRVKEARRLLTGEQRGWMETYYSALRKATNRKATPADRAAAWWEAAVAMLENGPSFRGTEADFHVYPWYGEKSALRPQRVSGFYFEGWGENSPKQKVFIAPTAKEKQRLAATAPHHALSSLTRSLAASHALKGASLLLDGSDKKAKLLNAAGWWLQDIDNRAADRIYFRIEKSFSETETGRNILSKRWFSPPLY